MHDDARTPLEAVGAGLARVEAFADGVGRRARLWGWLSLAAAPAIWAVFLRRWVFDSWGAFAAWVPLLVLLALPGLVLLGFARRVRRLTDLPERVSGEVAEVIAGARDGIAAEVAEVKASGLAGLRSLLGALRDLRGAGGGVKEIVGGVAGTLRLLNPLYLLVVLGAAFCAGLLAILALAAAVLLALAAA
ncbi:MAG: hypothetical protein KQH83_11570 [Actinobacteria bacterium]|nr:hypothetical protein [Actinomycetota bacterium]